MNNFNKKQNSGKEKDALTEMLIKNPTVDANAFLKVSIVCQTCGAKFSEYSKPYNLAKESIDLIIRDKKCRQCKNYNSLHVRIFQGANGEKWLGIGSPDSDLTTSSGIVTKNGIWDKEALIRLNRIGLRIGK